LNHKQKMLTKPTTKLFFKKYLHKVVVICASSRSFRKQNTDEQGKYIIQDHYSGYGLKLMKLLNKMQDYEVRVEEPLLSIYTNDKKEIDAIVKLNPDLIKYTCVPAANTQLTDGVIIMPKVPFEFKVTLGSTKQLYDSFVVWAENNGNFKLTNSCKEDLLRSKSWGGAYFYVTGEKNLLMAKMHLGGIINKVERIIKA